MENGNGISSGVVGRRLIFAEALALLDRFGRDAAWVRHCRAVARVAEQAGALIRKHRPIDEEYLRVSALLHDIGRYKTHHPVGHGVEGYRLLMELGHVEEASVCASHILCGLSREEASAHGLPDRDFLPRSLEERLVPMIDSVVELDRPTTLDRRIASIMRRYEGQEWFLERMTVAHARAQTFLAELEREQGISLEQVAADTLR